LPQRPQFCASEAGFTHAAPQVIWGALQVGGIVPLGPDFEQAAARKT
jgi:hypothetical protein